MRVIVCLEDRMGMMFNRRRLSKDHKVIESIESFIGKADVLYMNEYSYQLFEDTQMNIIVDESFLQCNENAYYFVEDQNLLDYQDKVDEIIVFWWNRTYPYDIKLEIDLNEFTLINREEFVGSSHELICKEVYRKVR